MPRKKPWTTTASGTWTPKALNEAQRMPMLAAQKPTAPITASPPREGWAKRLSANLNPSADDRRHLGDVGGDRLRPLPAGERRPRGRPRSGGISASSTPEDEQQRPPPPPGTTVSSTECLPGSTPVRSRTPKTISATG